ncbi:MAG: tetratricopeptide repeat protein [Deltaproteobacteria bacterium]|jgi:tetratricopeptide (TPR) repeat protein
MSYIHEALKKARKEKEVRHQQYDGITLRPGGKFEFISGRALWLGSFFLVLVALAAYLWLPSGSTISSIRVTAPPEVVPQPQTKEGANGLYEKARVFQKDGRFEEAKQLYEQTLSLAPDHVNALNNLGVIEIHNKRYTAARASFTKAIQLKPDYVDSHYNLACLYALEGGVSQSLTYLRKAMSLDQSVVEWARQDPDLGGLRGLPEFEAMVSAVK